jgi:hypothetical protein
MRMTSATETQLATPPGWTRVAAIAGGIGFLAPGVWAMVDPRSFFAALAAFEPYNQHFLQDIGAFQIGLGAVLLLAGAWVRATALTIALLGVGVGAAAHALSHVIGRNLGGTPQSDIPLFSVMAVLLLAAGWARWRTERVPAR